VIADVAPAGLACGTVQGVTFKADGDRIVAAGKRQPRKRGTLRQKTVRSVFSSLAAQWQLGLTGAQQTAWDNFATAIAENTGGCNPRPRTGYDWFLTVNLPRSNDEARSGVARARFVDPPSTADRGSAPPTFTFVGVSSGVFLVGLSFTGVPTLVPLAFGYVGPGLSPTVQSVGNPWHFFGTGAAAAGGGGITIASTPATPDNWYADWPPQVGSRVRIKARVQFADGRITKATREISTVASL